MGKRQFLLRRGNTLYYRRKFPVAVQQALGRKEFKRTLGTGDKASAEAAFISANIEYARLVEEVLRPSPRRGPRKAAASPVMPDYPTPYPRKLSELAEAEVHEIVERWYAGAMLQPPSLPETRKEMDEARKALLQDHADLARGDYRQLSAGLMPVVDRLLIQAGVVPDRKSPRYPDMLRLVARGQAARAEFEAAYFGGDDAPHRRINSSPRSWRKARPWPPGAVRRRKEPSACCWTNTCGTVRR